MFMPAPMMMSVVVVVAIMIVVAVMPPIVITVFVMTVAVSLRDGKRRAKSHAQQSQGASPESESELHEDLL
jgi:hypothetical protein